MDEDERNPFKRKNVVAAMLGDEGLEPERKLDLPTSLDVLVRDEASRKRQAKLRRMKPWQRRKYERDKKRVRIAVYIPRPLSDLVDEIAKYEIVSPSSAASWLIATGLKLWSEGKAQPPAVTKSRNLRTENSLAISPEWDGKRVQRTFGLPDLKEEIYAVAKQYRCGRSDAVAWLMSVGAAAYRAGRMPRREGSNSIQYPFKLKLPRRGNPSIPDGETSPGDVLRRYMEPE